MMLLLIFFHLLYLILIVYAIQANLIIRFIFYSIARLFSEGISENFILLGTFASKNTILDGPSFVDSNQKDADFLKIPEKPNGKLWYAFDSKCILDNDTDKITKYSFNQLKELYEEKVKKLRRKNIKKYTEVLEKRKELIVQFNLLNDTFGNLIMIVIWTSQHK